MSLLNRLYRFTRIAGKGLGAIIAMLAILIGAIYIHAWLPIHQVNVNCYDFRVNFTGPKAEKFISIVTKIIEDDRQPYFVRDDRIYSTEYGAHVDQIEKVIRYNVRGEWFSDTPTFENENQRRIVEEWRASKESMNVSKEWCRVIEAAIAKDGIDAEARRKNPDIWPPDQWPVPKE